jgi:hypothetical protein
MASIVGPGTGSTIIKQSVKDIIALMQYLVGLRDDSFQSVITQVAEAAQEPPLPVTPPSSGGGGETQ